MCHNGRDSSDSSSSGRSTIHHRGRRALAFGELRARSEEARDHLLLRDTGRLKGIGQARSKPSDLFRTYRRSKVRSDTRAICCQRSIARSDVLIELILEIKVIKIFTRISRVWNCKLNRS